MKVGITFSAFDLLHSGHIHMLREAKGQCDYLIAGLQSDPTIDRDTKNKPVQSMYERWVQLDACKYVDQVIPYQTEQDVVDMILSLPIDIRIIGDEYKASQFTGREECERLGIELYFNSRHHRFSSSELRGRLSNG